jgi:hypothetical protein
VTESRFKLLFKFNDHDDWSKDLFADEGHSRFGIREDCGLDEVAFFAVLLISGVDGRSMLLSSINIPGNSLEGSAKAGCTQSELAKCSVRVSEEIQQRITANYKPYRGFTARCQSCTNKLEEDQPEPGR